MPQLQLQLLYIHNNTNSSSVSIMSVSKIIYKTKTHENKLVLICEPMSFVRYC